MSISNYGQLKQALYTLFKRANIDADIQASVDVNTAELAAMLQVWGTKGTFVLGEAHRSTADRRYYTFPFGQQIDKGPVAYESVYLYQDGFYGPKLREQHRRSITVEWANYPQGNNKYLETWAQDEDGLSGIWFNVEPAENTDFWVWYKTYPQPLSVDGDTNTLLVNWPNVYYWAVARDVAISTHDAEMLALCEQRYTETMAAVQDVGNRSNIDGPVSIEGASTWL